MVNIFGSSTEKVGERGPSGAAGVGGIKDLILWFPDMMCEQIRKKLNVLTFLIETIPPAKDPDVEFSANKIVAKWKAFNDRKHIILIPANHGKGGKLKTLSLPLDTLKRYGLVFDKKEENMYYIENDRSIF